MHSIPAWSPADGISVPGKVLSFKWVNAFSRAESASCEHRARMISSPHQHEGAVDGRDGEPTKRSVCGICARLERRRVAQSRTGEAYTPIRATSAGLAGTAEAARSNGEPRGVDSEIVARRWLRRFRARPEQG